jgi:hypothetical protein
VHADESPLTGWLPETEEGTYVTTGTGPLTQRQAWKALQAHHAQIKDLHLRSLFAEPGKRGERMTAEGAGLFLDYSKNRVTDETLRLLIALADDAGVAERRDAMFVTPLKNARDTLKRKRRIRSFASQK